MNPSTIAQVAATDLSQPMMPMPITININSPYGLTTLNATVMVPDNRAVKPLKDLSMVETKDLIDELKDRVRDLEF